MQAKVYSLGKKRMALAAVMLSAFACYFISVTFFPHTHNTGQYTVTHSHPYSGTPDNPFHNHSAAQFLAIANLSALLAVLSAGVVFCAVARVSEKARGAEPTVGLLRRCGEVCVLRGPPAAVLG